MRAKKNDNSQLSLKNISGLFDLNPEDCNRVYIRERSPIGLPIGPLLGRAGTCNDTRIRSVLVPKSKQIHEIDIEIEQFIEVKNLRRTFDILQNDSDYKLGDVINYREVRNGHPTGYNVVFSIIYITPEKQKEDFIVIGIVPYSEKTILMA